MKIVVLVLIVAIMVSLFSSLRFMIKGGDDSNQMVKALTWRVGLSVVLFMFLMMGFWLGWFQPHQSNF